MEHCDEILQPPLHLRTHLMGGRVNILETYPKSEEIISFYLLFFLLFVTFIAMSLETMPLFGWNVLKCGVLQSMFVFALRT